MFCFQDFPIPKDQIKFLGWKTIDGFSFAKPQHLPVVHMSLAWHPVTIVDSFDPVFWRPDLFSRQGLLHPLVCVVTHPLPHQGCPGVKLTSRFCKCSAIHLVVKIDSTLSATCIVSQQVHVLFPLTPVPKLSWASSSGVSVRDLMEVLSRQRGI